MIVCFLVCLLYQVPAGQDAARLAAELDQKGAELFHLGRYDEAARHLKRAVQVWDQVSLIRPVDLSAPHCNLAEAYLAQGKLSAAESEARLARQFATPATRVRMTMLFARVRFQTGHYAEAERDLRAVLPNLEGPALATALNDLGMVRAAVGNLADARRLMEDSVAIREQRAAAGPECGRTIGNLALVCFRQGDLAAAVLLYGRAIPILEATLGADHAHVGMLLAEYSQALRRSGRKPEARTVERRAKAILAASLLPGLQAIDIRSPR